MSTVSTPRKAMKAGVDSESCRRRRGDTATSISKSKREEGLAKRRNLKIAIAEEAIVAGSPPKPAASTVSDLPRLANGMLVANTALASVVAVRKLLSVEDNPPVAEVIQCGMVPILIAALGSANDNLVFEVPSHTCLHARSLRAASSMRLCILGDSTAFMHIYAQAQACKTVVQQLDLTCASFSCMRCIPLTSTTGCLGPDQHWL
jgi:Importin beta binding domain